MARNPIIDFIDRQQWLGRVAGALAPAVRKTLSFASGGGAEVKDALNGVWLGHPLHPVLTDVPVGAWTAACVFDVAGAISGSESLDRAATAAIGVGLAGAVGSAATGLADWSDTDGTARRVGLVHGVMNLTATGFYVASLVARTRRQKWLGRLYGMLGYATAFGSAYLGGELVYTQQVGVDHAFGHDAPEQFTPVVHERELKEGRPVRVQVGDVPVVIVRVDGRVFALADTCAHLGGPLSEGTVEDCTITCPWHASTYRLEDGSIVHGPTTHAQPVYETRIRGGQVEIRMPRREPAVEEPVQRRAAS